MDFDVLQCMAWFYAKWPETASYKSLRIVRSSFACLAEVYAFRPFPALLSMCHNDSLLALRKLEIAAGLPVKS